MKKAELILTEAWQKDAAWLKLLSPLSCLYGMVSRSQAAAYRSGKKPIYRAPVPVLVIGNITVGGSGKTPLIIALVQLLMSRGVRAGVISRGYGGINDGRARLVLPSSLAHEVGDEPCLISQSINGATGAVLPMAVCAKRGQAVDLLMAHYPDTKLIISDDGLQHHALARDAEWIVVDADRGFGNAKLLPQGFLREPLSRLVGADVIYHYGKAADAHTSQHTHTMHLAPTAIAPLLADNKNLPPAADSVVYGLSGIGYPTRFFNTLSALGYTVKPKPLPDHHAFSVADIADLQDLPIITTEKDAVKLRLLHTAETAHLFNNIWVLPVRAQFSDGVYVLVDRLIEQFKLSAPKDKHSTD